ncbi:MAG: hypothetical protein ACLSVD_03025 [Eggerthellaceae bacterium]
MTRTWSLRRPGTSVAITGRAAGGAEVDAGKPRPMPWARCWRTTA